MAALIARRLGHGILVLFVVSLLAFLLSSLVGDPVASILGLNATPEDRAELAQRLGLDQPFFTRYATFLWNAIHFEFATSYAAQRPVSDLLIERIPATLELAAVALVLSLAVGIPLGLLAAVNRGRWWATALMSASVIGLSLPTFVVGILLIFVFSVQLGWLPSFGRGETVAIGWWTTGFLTASGLKALIMPALALAISQVALVARLVRAEMLDVLRADYIRFAKARGIKKRAIEFSHALRNTLIPVITVSGIQLGFLVAFAVVAEAVFQWPGLGLLFLQALGSTDIPVISAFLLLAAAFFVTINLVVDCLYVLVDPRLRAGGALGGGPTL
ncbi:MAG: ABC transporter permease [Pseudomonadota bacterium]